MVRKLLPSVPALEVVTTSAAQRAVAAEAAHRLLRVAAGVEAAGRARQPVQALLQRVANVLPVPAQVMLADRQIGTSTSPILVPRLQRKARRRPKYADGVTLRRGGTETMTEGMLGIRRIDDIYD